MANAKAMEGATPETKKALHPESDLKGGPDPAATNRDHPVAAGTRTAVPGAGVVSTGADAGPKETVAGQHTRGDYPGKDAPDARLMAPGAERPGTTDSGGLAASAARGGFTGSIGDETEVSQDSGQAPLSVPGQGTAAPSPGSSGVPATSDPNFPTNSQKGGVSREKGND